MKLKIKQGTTSKLIRVFAQDSAATDGSGKTGIAHNASGLLASFIPEGDSVVTAITLSSGTVGTYSSGGWSEVDAVNMPGVYELGLPDHAIDASSEGSVIVVIQGASGMAPILLEIELDAVDYKSASSFGLSNLDAAISDVKTKTDQLTFTLANKVDSNALSGNFMTDSSSLSNFGTLQGLIGSVGSNVLALNDFDPATQTVTTDAASRTASQADVSSLATTSDLAVVDSNVDAIKVKTDQMVFSNANELDCNAVTGGGGDDAATIYSYFTASSRQNTFHADVSSLATAASISALNDVSSLDIYSYFTASNRQDTFKATGFATVNPDNTSITAIKAKTDSLTFTISNQVDANALSGVADPVGSGAISHTVTVKIDNVPANAVDVWVTTDAAGTNVVAGTLVTNQAGQATFQLDAGSYYLWCQRSGVNFNNPTAFTVS